MDNWIIMNKRPFDILNISLKFDFKDYYIDVCESFSRRTPYKVLTIEYWDEVETPLVDVLQAVIDKIKWGKEDK